MKRTTGSLRETLQRAPLLNDELVAWAFGYVQNVAVAVVVIYAGLLLANDPHSVTEAVSGRIVASVGLLLFIWNAAHGIKRILLLPASRPFAGLLALLVYFAGGLILAALLSTYGFR